MGGRVHSVELDNGEIAELGAEWIFAGDEAPGHDRPAGAGRVRGARELLAPGAARYQRGLDGRARRVPGDCGRAPGHAGQVLDRLGRA
ncbi:MAG TPA: hypothetical protein VJ913_05455 [Actinomycetota bacterium]|nr:hypothetical protein [Actinomycetota bacterium]